MFDVSEYSCIKLQRECRIQLEERSIEITLLFIYAGKSLPDFPEDRLTSRSGTKTADLAGDKLYVVGAYTIYTQSAGFISTWCIRIVLRGTLKPRRVNAESRSPSSSIAYTRPYKREMTGYYEANCALALFPFANSRFHIRQDIFIFLLLYQSATKFHRLVFPWLVRATILLVILLT